MKKKVKTKAKTKMKTKRRNENKNENKNENEKKKKTKTKTKLKTNTKMKNKMKTKTKMRIKSFCVFVNSTLPRYALDGQLSLTWPGSAIVFLFVNFARGLAVPQMVSSFDWLSSALVI